MIEGKKIIALCTSRIYDPQVHSFIECFNETLKVHDIRVWIYAINADIYWNEQSDSAELEIFDIIPFDRIDGIVIMDEKIKCRFIAERIISRAALKKLPVIVVDGVYEGTTLIRFDYASAFEMVVRHIIHEHGVKKPHMMAGIPGNVFSEERLDAFKKVLREENIPFSDDMVSYGEFWAAPAREATRALIKREELPEALICANDIMAINACDVLKNAGYRVPEDILVTGFDGYDEAFLSVPGITTVSCDSVQLADATAKTLLTVIGGETIPSEVIVVPKIFTNESCGCPRCVEIANGLALKRFNNEFYRFQDDIRMIQNIVTQMITSDTPEKMVSRLRSAYTRNIFNDHTGNVCCIVREACLRKDVNYFLCDSKDSDDTAYCLLYDAGTDDDRVRPFDPEYIVPRLDELMKSSYPLIFESLDYMGRSMGYLCYFMDSYAITDYARTPNITDMICMGLGGYINMCHQQYLRTKVEQMYKYDALTGLYNRLAFSSAFEALKASSEYDGAPLTVMMADLNHLKWINDSLGHDAGDIAIAAVGKALRAACPENALCVRFGGDEMLAFIPGSCDVDNIIREIDGILDDESRDNGFDISASCGSYSTVLSGELDLEDAVRRADEVMYAAKRRAHGNVKWNRT